MNRFLTLLTGASLLLTLSLRAHASGGESPQLPFFYGEQNVGDTRVRVFSTRVDFPTAVQLSIRQRGHQTKGYTGYNIVSIPTDKLNADYAAEIKKLTAYTSTPTFYFPTPTESQILESMVDSEEARALRKALKTAVKDAHKLQPPEPTKFDAVMVTVFIGYTFYNWIFTSGMELAPASAAFIYNAMILYFLGYKRIAYPLYETAARQAKKYHDYFKRIIPSERAFDFTARQTTALLASLGLTGVFRSIIAWEQLPTMAASGAFWIDIVTVALAATFSSGAWSGLFSRWVYEPNAPLSIKGISVIEQTLKITRTAIYPFLNMGPPLVPLVMGPKLYALGAMTAIGLTGVAAAIWGDQFFRYLDRRGVLARFTRAGNYIENIYARVTDTFRPEELSALLCRRSVSNL